MEHASPTVGIILVLHMDFTNRCVNNSQAAEDGIFIITFEFVIKTEMLKNKIP